MSTVLVTGSGGLIGSECVRHFVEAGYDVVGIENDMRAEFFGPGASTAPITERLCAAYPAEFRWFDLDVRDGDGVDRLFADVASDLELIVHTAAQPSHDWAASAPKVDFTVNANGTLNLLEATRRHKPEATFVFTSTNKVYGDRPNRLPLIATHTLHSLFGASKAAADLLVQEYGRYFDMPTVCFRGGCLTGPAHRGARLHGFLAYLMRCTVTGEHYTVFGYAGKQVRDNIHAADVASAFGAFHRSPRAAAVYNLGGGRANAISMLEAIEACERIAGRELSWTLSDEARIGDHRWWISDLGAFRADYPDWRISFNLDRTLREIHDANLELWTA